MKKKKAVWLVEKSAKSYTMRIKKGKEGEKLGKDDCEMERKR